MIKKIIILILILGFIAVVVFLDVPGVEKVLGSREKIEQEKQVFSEKQDLLVKMEKLSQLYEENQENLEKANYILPSGQDLPNLIVQLEALAFGGGLILEQIAFSEIEDPQSADQTKPKDHRVLTISLRLIGDYPSFENFLKTLEENMRLMDIVSINFSTQLGEGFQFLNFDLNIKTYYQ